MSNPTTLVVETPPSGQPETTQATGYVTIPGLMANITCTRGDSLRIAFSAEAKAAHGKRLKVRALVDGDKADPGDAVLKTGDGTWNSHEFIFSKQNLSDGNHTVQLQWKIDTGGQAEIGDRSLTLASGRDSGGVNSLVVTTPASGQPELTQSTTFVNVPGLAAKVTCVGGDNLEISFSTEAKVSGGKRLMVRALVDGHPVMPSDSVLATGDDHWNAHAFIFTAVNVACGVRDVLIQWKVDAGGTAELGDRTLALVAGKDAGPGNSQVVLTPKSGQPEKTQSTGYIDISGLTDTIACAQGQNLQISFSAETQVTNGKRVKIRALIDGQPAQPSDAVLMTGDGTWNAQSSIFTAKNLSAGNHTIQMQWKVDAGGLAQLGDRTLTLGTSPDGQMNRPGHTTWYVLKDVSSKAGPAISAHVDGKIYAVGIAPSGYVEFSTTDSPGYWSPSQAIGATPSLHANAATEPQLVLHGNTLHLFVRGDDDNLYEAHSTRGVSWTNWRKLTSAGEIKEGSPSQLLRSWGRH